MTSHNSNDHTSSSSKRASWKSTTGSTGSSSSKSFFNNNNSFDVTDCGSGLAEYWWIFCYCARGGRSPRIPSGLLGGWHYEHAHNDYSQAAHINPRLEVDHNVATGTTNTCKSQVMPPIVKTCSSTLHSYFCIIHGASSMIHHQTNHHHQQQQQASSDETTRATISNNIRIIAENDSELWESSRNRWFSRRTRRKTYHLPGLGKAGS